MKGEHQRQHQRQHWRQLLPRMLSAPRVDLPGRYFSFLKQIGRREERESTAEGTAEKSAE
jgi:hypothetical protein